MSSSQWRAGASSISQADVAYMLGVSTRTVQRMSDEEPPIPRNEDATYDTRAVVAWHAERQARLFGYSEDDEAALTAAQVRRTTAQAEREELLVAELRGDMIRVEDSVAFWRPVFEQLDAELRNAPSRFAADVAAKAKTKTVVARRILDVVFEGVRARFLSSVESKLTSVDGDRHSASA